MKYIVFFKNERNGLPIWAHKVNACKINRINESPYADLYNTYPCTPEGKAKAEAYLRQQYLVEITRLRNLIQELPEKLEKILKWLENIEVEPRIQVESEEGQIINKESI